MEEEIGRIEQIAW